MDFSLSEDQEEIAQLAARIFEERVPPERVKEVEAQHERFDRELWAELARANLLGLALPEETGGSGLGVVEECLVLEQQGRRVAPIPLLPTLASASAIVAHGSEGQRSRFLPKIASGEEVLSVALTEEGSNEVMSPRTHAVRDAGGWRLEGAKRSVAYARVADAVLVPARSDDGLLLLLVDPRSEGIRVDDVEATNREPQSHLRFDSVRVGDESVVAGPESGERAVRGLLDHFLIGLCAIQVGVAEEALRMAAAYTSERKQFGRPLATNQGVALRAADAYIDVEAMRATMWQAAWRSSVGLDAAREVMVAKWWASDAGQRVVHSTQHLHGGLGADIDYPVHRYFLWGKQIEVTLGGASQQLARLGREIAAGAR